MIRNRLPRVKPALGGQDQISRMVKGIIVSVQSASKMKMFCEAFVPAPIATSCGCGQRGALTRRRPLVTGAKTRTPSRIYAAWVKQSASIHVEAGPEEAYDTYSNLEDMPQWSPWLRAVRVDPADGMLSEWVLFSRGIEISWKARITDATRGERIAWKSESGLTNRGSVLFADSSSASGNGRPVERSSVTLAVEFDVPDPLAGAFDNNFIGRFVRETLLSDLKRFRTALLRKKRQQKLDRPRSSNI